MRLFVVGDIHGCATALDVLLETIGLKGNDKLITLGDYINKGTESRVVVERLIYLWSQDLLIPLKGNHELKLARALELGKTQLGATTLIDQVTLKSYSKTPKIASICDIRNNHLRFLLKHCQNYFETDTHLFAHGTPEANKPLPQQSEENLLENKFINPVPHVSGKVLVCGHTPQRNGKPVNMGHAICLDTAVCEGQWLTCLNVYTGQLWQANQQKELRTSWIQEYLNPIHKTLAFQCI